MDMITGEATATDALEHFCRPANPPALKLSDFEHYARESELMRDLLRGALREQAGGVNILLYGPPGTGKTELARALVAEAGLFATESTETDTDGDPLRVRARLSRYVMTQKLLASAGNGVVIFDEVEELLADNDSPFTLFGQRSPAADDKAWKIRLLENNPVPSIWVGNVIRDIDPALLRRFAFSLKMEAPPRKKRLQLLEETFAGWPIEKGLLDRISEDKKLMPADIERTHRVLSLTGSKDASDADARLAMVMGSRPGGVSARRVRSPTRTAQLEYNPRWINASPDISELTASLRHHRYGRLGLFGPPGTGKTEYAHHLARELDTPLVIKRASDLLAPYLGETEARIAAAFDEVRNDSGVLLIDEVDSFLQDRSRATRTWEISQVNELLSQIDAFEGILVVASNFSERLDSALARRLDFKVRFDYMTPAAAREALTTATVALGCSKRTVSLNLGRQPTARLRGVSLGDIACAMRHCLLRHSSPTASDFLSTVEAEVRHRSQQSGHGIGFTTRLN